MAAKTAQQDIHATQEKLTQLQYALQVSTQGLARAIARQRLLVCTSQTLLIPLLPLTLLQTSSCLMSANKSKFLALRIMNATKRQEEQELYADPDTFPRLARVIARFAPSDISAPCNMRVSAMAVLLALPDTMLTRLV